MTPCSGDGGSPDRWDAISSTSSMNTTACSSSAISRNVSRSAPARPLGSAASREGNTSTNGHSRRDAIAFANVVFPVPGGPKRTTARGGTTPNSSARSASASGSTSRRSSSSFSLRMPATFSQRSRARMRPPRRPRGSSSWRCTGMVRSKYRRFFLSTKPRLRNASTRVSDSGISADSLFSPCGAIRFSTAASSEVPIPRPRYSGSVARKTIQPWSCAARPTAAPTTMSPCTATTAWSFSQEARTSESA